MADLAVALGKREGVAGQDLEHLRMAALLHDLGKLGLDETVLRKPYSLPHSGDWKHIREHPVVGEGAFMAPESRNPVAELIRHHHELLDGFGFPDGLAGEDLARGVRILAVANMSNSLRRGGVFVRGLSLGDALTYLRGRGGTP